MKALKEFINSNSEKSDAEEAVIEHAEMEIQAKSEGKPLPKPNAEVIRAKVVAGRVDEKNPEYYEPKQSLNYRYAEEDVIEKRRDEL